VSVRSRAAATRSRVRTSPGARAIVAILTAAAAVGLWACGGDGEESASTTTTTTAETGRERVVVEASNGAFNPQAVYEEAAPGVVTVLSVFGEESGLLGGGRAAGQGSGFVVSDDGEVVTNAHVVTDAEATGGGPINEAREVYVQFPDRNQVPAEVVGFDPFYDVALLKVDPDGLDLTPLELGSSSEVEVGQPVAAIGSPFGEQNSLSIGVISATGRSVESLTDFQIDEAIQTDAAINPGNSGGPLLDAEGRVLGINQQIRTASGADEGVGFAVPVDAVDRSLSQLREDGEAEYAYIGVTTQALYPQLADRLDLDSPTGALVAEVVPDSPADEAGLEGGDQEVRFQGSQVTVGGDVIVSVEGEELVAEADLARLISDRSPGETITLEVISDGSTDEVDVTLGERPEQTPQ
jgi:S1-C subfamily serine protease